MSGSLRLWWRSIGTCENMNKCIRGGLFYPLRPGGSGLCPNPPAHLKVNCPEGAREATLGCPHLANAKQGRLGVHWQSAKSPEPWFRAFALTIPQNWDILSIESGATGRRFPQSCYKEVTAGLRDGRLLLFIIHDLNDQCDKSDDEGTKLKQLGPCNHTAHPLFLGIGGKEDYPRRTGEPPTVTGSTADRITQKFDKCKSRPSSDGRLRVISLRAGDGK